MTQAVLVAGGTKGIGLATAERLASPGSNIFLNYAHDDTAAKIAAERITKRGATPHLIKGDVGSEAGGKAVIDAVGAIVDRLDVLVHSAALQKKGQLATQSIQEIRQAIEVGGMALLYLVQPAMKLMGDGSSVLFLSGASTHLVIPGYGALASAKALGDCFVRYLSIECAAQGINFNTLGSGPVDTELYRSAAPRTAAGDTMPPPTTPNGRRIAPEDLAEVAAFLVSKGGSMIRGQVVLVDGGMSTTIRGR